MTISISWYVQFVGANGTTTWSGINGTAGDWILVFHGLPSGTMTDLGGPPDAINGGWLADTWQLLTQVDAGSGLPKWRVWAGRIADDVSNLKITVEAPSGVDNHSHLYYLTGVRPGTGIDQVFSVGAAAPGSSSASQTAPLYAPDASGLLIGAWLSGGAAINYTTLGGLTARTEVDGNSSTSRTGETTITAQGPATQTAAASAAEAWAAVTVVVRDATGPVTFPSTPLRMRTEIAPGVNPGDDPAKWADSWVDVTADAQPRDGGVTIARGRQDEATTVGPSSMTVTLDNTAGKYVRLNPNSPFYGSLNKNTPLRLWVDPGSGWDLRYTGFVSEFPPRQLGGDVDQHMPITANGPVRRMQSGKVLHSSMYRSYATLTGLYAYYPLETDTASGLLGGAAMRGTGTYSFSTDAGPAGSGGAISFEPGGKLTSTVTGMPNTGGWHVSWWLDLPADFDGTTTLSVVVDWMTPGSPHNRWLAYVGDTNGAMAVIAYDQSLNQTVIAGTVDLRGTGPRLIGIMGSQDPGLDGSVYVQISVDGVLDQDGFLLQPDGINIAIENITAITSLNVNNYADATTTIKGSVCHLSATTVASNKFTDTVAPTYLPFGTGHAGERAADRIRRLADEEAAPIVVVGDDGTSEPMGVQPVATLLDILRDCETADGGVLYEQRDGRIAYRCRSGRYNATPALTLDWDSGHVAPPFEPTDDDQRTRNDWTVSRTGGGSARVTDQTSIDAIGLYDDSTTVNVADDGQLLDQAAWRVHLGTDNGYRYPAVTPNLNGRPTGLIPGWLALDIGSAITITNPANDLPPGDIALFAEGYTEVIDTPSWSATINASPGGPWRVAALDDTVLGRCDTDGSQLAASATSTATSLSIATTSGPLWTTDPADLPFDLLVGGEQVTVVDTAKRITDTFTRSIASGWGTATTGQAWSTSGGAASDYSATGSTGRVTCTDLTTRRFTAIGTAITDATIVASITTPVVASGDTITGGLVLRRTDDNNLYLFQVSFFPDSTVTVEIFKRVSGTFTSLGSQAAALTYSAGTPVRLRAWCVGSTLKAKAWVLGTGEPDWQVIATDTTFTGAGAAGTKTSLGSANTNTLPVAVDYDDVDLLTPAITGTSSPQTFTVVRSVNGIVKAHTAGEDVRLAQPMILAL